MLTHVLQRGGLHAQGTSMAAPHVAGVAALIISRTASKRMAPAQVAAALAATATKKPCPTSEPLSSSQCCCDARRPGSVPHVEWCQGHNSSWAENTDMLRRGGPNFQPVHSSQGDPGTPASRRSSSAPAAQSQRASIPASSEPASSMLQRRSRRRRGSNTLQSAVTAAAAVKAAEG